MSEPVVMVAKCILERSRTLMRQIDTSSGMMRTALVALDLELISTGAKRVDGATIGRRVWWSPEDALALLQRCSRASFLGRLAWNQELQQRHKRPINRDVLRRWAETRAAARAAQLVYDVAVSASGWPTTKKPKRNR